MNRHELSPRGRFVLLYGVVFYGGGLFVLFNALHLFRLHQHGASFAGIILWLAVTAVVCPILGGIFGMVMWSRLAARAKRR